MEIDDFVQSLKPFTKIFICGSLLIGLINTLKLINPYYLVMTVPDGLWNPLRYLTCLFFMSSLKLNTLMNLLFFYYTNNGLEESFMPHRYGDYLYLIFLSLIGNIIIVSAFSWNSYFLLNEPFTMTLIYIYCKKNPNQSFLVFFILKLKAMYFIWFYMLMTALSGRFIYAISGLIVGHLYIYFKEILPISHRKYYLDTPRLFNLIAQKFLNLMGERAQVPQPENPQENDAWRPFNGGGMRIGQLIYQQFINQLKEQDNLLILLLRSSISLVSISLQSISFRNCIQVQYLCSIEDSQGNNYFDQESAKVDPSPNQWALAMLSLPCKV